MKIGQKFERIDETKESSTLKAEKQCDRELLDVLTSEDNGMFKAGLLPQGGMQHICRFKSCPGHCRTGYRLGNLGL